MNARWTQTAPLAALCAVLPTMLLLPTVFGGFVWDDHQLIAQNPAVTGLDFGFLLTHHFWDTPHAGAAASGYYRPVATVAHALVWAAGGGTAAPFHVLSLVLHALCSTLAFLWLTHRLDGASTPEGRVAVALATVVFALHPARVQSVAWASASTDLWATFFVLIGLNLLTRRRGWTGSAFAGVAMGLGVLSKETAVVAPVLVIADHILGAGKRLSGGEMAAMLAPVGLSLIVRSSVVGLPTGGAGFGSIGEAAGRGAFTLGSYLRQTALPLSPDVQINATFDQVWSGEAGALLAMVLGGLAFTIAIALTASATKRPALRPWAADVAWLIVPLIPVSNLLPLGEGVTIASRLLYMPLLGATALAARALVPLFATRTRAVAFGTCGVVLILFAVACSSELGHWQDDLSLTRHQREQRPNDALVADSLVRVLARHGELEEAYVVMSERLDDDSSEPGADFASATWAFLRLSLTSDVDQSDLTALRNFFDSVADMDVSRQTLQLPERDLTLQLSSPERAELMDNPAYGRFYDSWGWSHARTLDTEGALRIFEGAPEAAMGPLLLHDRRARALGWNEDWDAALAVTQRARQRFPAHPWGALTEALTRGRDLRASPPVDPVELATLRSRVMSDLGLPALGRALLAPLGDLDDVRIVHARVQAHISDQRFDLAQRELESAAARLPDHTVELEAARVEVASLVRSVPTPRTPPIWTRARVLTRRR